VRALIGTSALQIPDRNTSEAADALGGDAGSVIWVPAELTFLFVDVKLWPFCNDCGSRRRFLKSLGVMVATLLPIELPFKLFASA